jgi:glucose dehydrogenase
MRRADLCVHLTSIRSLAPVLLVALPLLLTACGEETKVSEGADAGADAASPSTPNRWRSFGSDFSNSRSNLAENKISPSTVATFSRKWEFPGGAVTSTPAVVDGVVYFSDWGQNLYAVDQHTGVTLWKAPITAIASGSPFVSDDAVYISGEGAIVNAVKRSDGSKLWDTDVETTPLARIWSSPAVVGDLLIIGVGSYQVFAPGDPPFRGSVVGVDVKTRTERWRASVCEEGSAGVSVWSSAAIDEEAGLAFIGTGQAYKLPALMSDSLVAIRYATGEIAWSHRFTADDAFQIDITRNGMTVADGKDFDVGLSPNLFLNQRSQFEDSHGELTGRREGRKDLGAAACFAAGGHDQFRPIRQFRGKSDRLRTPFEPQSIRPSKFPAFL